MWQQTERGIGHNSLADINSNLETYILSHQYLTVNLVFASSGTEFIRLEKLEISE